MKVYILAQGKKSFYERFHGNFVILDREFVPEEHLTGNVVHIRQEDVSYNPGCLPGTQEAIIFRVFQTKLEAFQNVHARLKDLQGVLLDTNGHKGEAEKKKVFFIVLRQSPDGETSYKIVSEAVNESNLAKVVFGMQIRMKSNQNEDVDTSIGVMVGHRRSLAQAETFLRFLPHVETSLGATFSAKGMRENFFVSLFRKYNNSF